MIKTKISSSFCWKTPTASRLSLSFSPAIGLCRRQCRTPRCRPRRAAVVAPCHPHHHRLPPALPDSPLTPVSLPDRDDAPSPTITACRRRRLAGATAIVKHHHPWPLATYSPFDAPLSRFEEWTHQVEDFGWIKIEIEESIVEEYKHRITTSIELLRYDYQLFGCQLRTLDCWIWFMFWELKMD